MGMIWYSNCVCVEVSLETAHSFIHTVSMATFAVGQACQTLCGQSLKYLLSGLLQRQCCDPYSMKWNRRGSSNRIISLHCWWDAVEMELLCLSIGLRENWFHCMLFSLKSQEPTQDAKWGLLVLMYEQLKIKDKCKRNNVLIFETKNTLLHSIWTPCSRPRPQSASEETRLPATALKQPQKARGGEQQTRTLYLIDFISSSAFKARKHCAAFLAGGHGNRWGGSAMHRCFFGRNRC